MKYSYWAISHECENDEWFQMFRSDQRDPNMDKTPTERNQDGNQFETLPTPWRGFSAGDFIHFDSFDISLS